jgi:hypothetical protein
MKKAAKQEATVSATEISKNQVPTANKIAFAYLNCYKRVLLWKLAFGN